MNRTPKNFWEGIMMYTCDLSTGGKGRKITSWCQPGIHIDYLSQTTKKLFAFFHSDYPLILKTGLACQSCARYKEFQQIIFGFSLFSPPYTPCKIQNEDAITLSINPFYASSNSRIPFIKWELLKFYSNFIKVKKC